jgi:ComEC/Rec2-related protein
MTSHGSELQPISADGDPLPDPGLPPHEPRLTDTDVKAAKRAERQVSVMFSVAALGSIGFVVAYLALPLNGDIGRLQLSNLLLGITLGGALFLIGLGAIQWAKKLMPDVEMVQERHPLESTPEEKAEAIAAFEAGTEESGIGRRSVIRNSLLGALALLPLPVVVILGDLGPLSPSPPLVLSRTIWSPGMRVVNDVTFEPIRPQDIEVGQLINALPEAYKDVPEGQHADALRIRADASVILVRMELDEFVIEPGREDPARRLARLRGELSERIRAEAGAPTGGLIAALLTGDRSGVTESQTEALRASGLGHLLAISGLHMGLFAGGVFFAVRFLFAALFRFSRARDPAVPAAVAALCAAAVYLALSGFAVSTQRAFVMSALVLAAVLARRRAISLRGLSLAALAVLALEPQSVAEPGFRMSFGAAGALVVVYALWRRLRPAPREASSRSNLARAGAWFAGLATTSLVAGLATAGFSAMHFNRLAGWGLLANLAAMPVFTLWVMPLAALGLALTPLGLEAPLLRLAGQGMELVVAIAELAAAAPGAYVAVAAPPSWAATVYTTGFALLILGSALQRAAGLFLLVAALVFWGLARPAEVYVAQNGVAVIRTDQGWTSTRPDRPGYGAEMFLRRAGATHWGAVPLSCDEASCTTRSRSGWLIAFPETPAALAEDCRRADVIIARFPAPGALRRSCQAYLLDETERARRGGVTLEPAPDGAFLRRGALDDTRLWRASDTSG